MIGYTGFRGAGKTLNLVKDLYEIFKLEDNIVILSNTPLLFPPHPKTGKLLTWFRWYDIDEIVAFFYLAMEYGDKMMDRRWIVVIDEASVVINARFWQNLDPALGSFMFQSRHVNVDIWFTTQHCSMVDANLRKLVEEWRHCEKIYFFGRLWPTKMSKVSILELTPEGSLIAEHGGTLTLRPQKYWSMYKTDGQDSIVGLGRTMESRRGHAPAPELYDFFHSVLFPSLPSASPPEGETGEGENAIVAPPDSALFRSRVIGKKESTE